MPFDSVISIGGQSLLDGLWRILQPALRSLSNPLPVTLPGMTDTWVRIRRMTPALSAANPSELTLAIEFELLGNLLMTASVKAGTVNLSLPSGTLKFPMATSTAGLNLPTTAIPVTLPSMTQTPVVVGGLTLAPSGTGSMALPTGGTVDLRNVTGNLDFLAGVPGNVGLPLPSIVPIPLNFTPATPALVTVTLPMSAAPINAASAFSLRIDLGAPTVGAITAFPAANIISTAVKNVLLGLLPQLGVALIDPTHWPVGAGPTDAEIDSTANAIQAAAQSIISDNLEDKLTGLAARTGRLVFPPPGTGATCETSLLPTAARALFTPNRPLLQIGFLRTGISGTPFTFPPFFASGAAEVQVALSIRYLRDVLCCLIEKIPNLTFMAPSAPINSVTRNCCTWPLVSLEFPPITLRGPLFLCVVGGPNTMKTIELSGSLMHVDSFFANIGIDFTLTLNIELNNVAALTGLSFAKSTVSPDVRLQPGVWAMLVVASALVLSAPGLAILIIGIPILVIELIKTMLREIVDTIVSGSHALTSPVAVPPAIFDAFGNFVPASLTIDDLVCTGSLATPTSPWELLPINAPKLVPPPNTGGGPGD